MMVPGYRGVFPFWTEFPLLPEGGVRQVTLYQGVIPVGMPGAQHLVSTELAALVYSSSFLTDVAREI